MTAAPVPSWADSPPPLLTGRLNDYERPSVGGMVRVRIVEVVRVRHRSVAYDDL